MTADHSLSVIVFDAPREFLRVRGLISDKLPPTAASQEERKYARSLCRLVERKGYTGDLRFHRVFELWVYCGCHPAAWHRNPDEDEDLWNEYKASELFHYMGKWDFSHGAMTEPYSRITQASRQAPKQNLLGS